LFVFGEALEFRGEEGGKKKKMANPKAGLKLPGEPKSKRSKASGKLVIKTGMLRKERNRTFVSLDVAHAMYTRRRNHYAS